MNYYLKVIQNYAVFTGRARRSEYWNFMFVNLFFSFIALIADHIFGIAMPLIGYGPITLLYSLGIFSPGLGVLVRRLHDVGKSGWFCLIALIPFIGAVWLFVLLVSEGNAGENEYGTNPKVEVEQYKDL